MDHSQNTKHLHVKKRLLLSARELFGIHGLKKTSIADLTKAVGIAQGSFYAYFSSKEELFFELVEVEEAKIKEELFHLLQNEAMTKHLFKTFLLKSLELIQQNPIIRSLFDKEHMQQLLNKLPPERLEKHINMDTNSLSPMIEHLQQQQIMVKKDPKIISGVIRSFILLFLHQEAIGKEIFEETMALHAEMIADGLIQGG
jgi:AcrR family transcriptional regulator